VSSANRTILELPFEISGRSIMLIKKGMEEVTILEGNHVLFHPS
jgi:hypothetical protein